MDIIISIPDAIYPRVTLAVQKSYGWEEGESDKDLYNRVILQTLEATTRSIEISEANRIATDAAQVRIETEIHFAPDST